VQPTKIKRTIAVHTSSATPEWYTPDHIVESVLKAFAGYIDLDPCTNSKIAPNIPARTLFDKTDDGIKQSWFGKVFVNPPYGREIKQWVTKCCEEYANGLVSEIILLVPARVDTKWFAMIHDNHWCSVDGRLKFKSEDGLDKNSAPFPSAVIYFGKDGSKFREVFSKLGKVYN